jgi:hypothetical protein
VELLRAYFLFREKAPASARSGGVADRLCRESPKWLRCGLMRAWVIRSSLGPIGRFRTAGMPKLRTGASFVVGSLWASPSAPSA